MLRYVGHGSAATSKQAMTLLGQLDQVTTQFLGETCACFWEAELFKALLQLEEETRAFVVLRSSESVVSNVSCDNIIGE